MGVFWWRNKSVDDKENSKGIIDELPDDLSQFLEKKESQLSNREFKELIRRQSDNLESKKEDSSATAPDFLQMLQAKAPERNDSLDKEDDEKTNNTILPPTPISTAANMKKPKEYLSYELEQYRRNNDEKESILTNCSEIQNAFYDCLGTQSIWDRLTAVSHLESDKCTKLADFFMACTEVQKKAFLMFDYSSLDTIEEMQEASRKIDAAFNTSFKNVDDVQDKDKFLAYTREIRKEREDFFTKFGK